MTILCLYRFQLAGPNLVSLFHAQPWKGLDNAHREVPLRPAHGLPTEAADFDRCVQKYRGNYRTRRFSCLDQFLCMAFAQLTYRNNLRHIEICLNSLKPKLYHVGIRGTIARNTLAKANQNRNWRIYADFAVILIARAEHSMRATP